MDNLDLRFIFKELDINKQTKLLNMLEELGICDCKYDKVIKTKIATISYNDEQFSAKLTNNVVIKGFYKELYYNEKSEFARFAFWDMDTDTDISYVFCDKFCYFNDRRFIDDLIIVDNHVIGVDDPRDELYLFDFGIKVNRKTDTESTTYEEAAKKALVDYTSGKLKSYELISFAE